MPYGMLVDHFLSLSWLSRYSWWCLSLSCCLPHAVAKEVLCCDAYANFVCMQILETLTMDCDWSCESSCASWGLGPWFVVNEDGDAVEGKLDGA